MKTVMLLFSTLSLACSALFLFFIGIIAADTVLPALSEA